MTVSDDVPKTRLKIKFSFKNTDLLLEGGSCEVRQQPCINEECAQNNSFNGNKESVLKKSDEGASHTTESFKLYSADSFIVVSPVQSSRKRGPLRVIDPVMNKRQKMDCSLKRHCGNILETLIKHPAALGFSEPVDPIKLNIPDYFSVISSPMDLGTVRAKLQDNMYISIEEFKDDVRLTFSNAMLYNPSDNIFNRNAKKLDSIFSTKLKSLDARLKHESMNHEQSCHSSGRERKAAETEHLCLRKSHVHSGLAPIRTMSTKYKRKPTKEFVEATKPKMTQILTILDSRASNEPARNVQSSRFPGEVLQKGISIGNKSTCRAVKTMSLASMVATRCSSCGSLKCQCSVQNGYSCASSRNLASEIYTGQNCDAFKMERGSGFISDTCKSDPESDGAVSVLDEENICSSPQSSSLGTSGVTAEVSWTCANDLLLSPKKALRAAMLKSRFAGTILKAKQKTLLDHVVKEDPGKFRQQKEKLEKQQQEEKARIEAQIRAAEVASSLMAQEELRIRREKERDAARVALQKMEKTVEIGDNLNILEEFDMFRWSMPSNHLVYGSDKSLVLFEASQGGYLGNILEQLGLFMKDDYMDYEDEEEGLFLYDREGLTCP